MDLSQIKLELIDFTKIALWKWRLRRFFIGYLLLIYYSYTFLFFAGLLLQTEKASTDNVWGVFEYSLEYPLWITITFGFLGSIFLITRTFVRTVNKKDLPLVWYVTRPLQGILMSVFLYYAFKAGELVFYNSGATTDGTGINVWTISILAILVGVFPEEAYDRLHSIATRLFKSRQET